MLASYSFTRAPLLLLLIVSPEKLGIPEEGTTHAAHAVKAVYDEKDVSVCLPKWL